MTPLFFYGTLRHLPLLEIVLGKELGDISQQDARLLDHAVYAVAEGPFPTLVTEKGGVADGVIVTGLSVEDLARFDYYEGGFAYDLVPVTLADGQDALVYMSAPGTWTPTTPWVLQDWVEKWGEMSGHAAREVMGYMGQRARDEVGAMFGSIRARAWARTNAKTSKHGAGTRPGTVQINQRKRVYANFYALDELELQHSRFDGTLSEPLERAVFVPMDAALVLPYDPARDMVLLVEQMRLGPIGRGDPMQWQLEPIAGHIDPGETPKEAAHREAYEEAGLTLETLHPVAEIYPSPGNSTEFFYIYVGITQLPDDSTGVGGLASEAEDIRSQLMPLDELLELCDTQQVANSPLVAAAYWLARHRDRLSLAGPRVRA